MFACISELVMCDCKHLKNYSKPTNFLERFIYTTFFLSREIYWENSSFLICHTWTFLQVFNEYSQKFVKLPPQKNYIQLILKRKYQLNDCLGYSIWSFFLKLLEIMFKIILISQLSEYCCKCDTKYVIFIAINDKITK